MYPTTTISTIRTASHSTVRSRSCHVADGFWEIPGSRSPGVSINWACTPSTLRTEGTRPSGSSTSAGAQGAFG